MKRLSEENAAMPHYDIEFVVTPFLPIHQPALGISNLISIVRSVGYSTTAHYLNVVYAKQLGWKLSHFIENFFSKDLLLGDMIFTPALWGDAATPWSEYEQVLKRIMSYAPEFLIHYQDMNLVDEIKRIRDASPAIIDYWADILLENNPSILAFTTTFQQNAATLSLARRIKEKACAPAPLIVLGGGNCEGEMGQAIANNFPFVDVVVSGEGENVIASIIKERMSGNLPGRYIAGETVKNMDALPVPDFSDYFKAIENETWREKTNLVVESSRGCWWGVKSHCKFCGLNGSNMAFRSKTPKRFAANLANLRAKYKRNTFVMSDNIMDMNYINELFPLLKGDKEGFKLFYETKSNLKRAQIGKMSEAGVVYIQAGIESLSTKVLRLMGKGTTFLQNLQTLKWCKEAGIGVAWNFLYDFPGEEKSEYTKLIELIPSLVHLPFPAGSGQIRMDRFSPYWRSPEQYGLINVKHAGGYDFVYSGIPAPERERLAYFFDFDYSDGKKTREYFKETQGAIFRWWHAAKLGATLQFEKREDRTVVKDTRFHEAAAISDISDAEFAFLRAFDAKMSVKKACETVSAQVSGLSGDELLAAVEKLRLKNWVMEEDGIFISLVLDFSRGKLTRNKT